ncbi:MAG: hypothetical protein GX085_01250 [Firmicutes bacterium]|jgi:hypothetical protein|nr:hypothetical protein [Bacillota bacterium]
MKKSRLCPQMGARTDTRARVRKQAWLAAFLILLCSASVFAAEFTLRFTVPPRAEFYLSTDYVDLGLPRTTGGVTYFEGKNVVILSFRTNIASPWEIHISGTDFRSAAGTSIPINRLQWRMGRTGGYRFMPPEGESLLVMDWQDFADKVLAGQQFQISYYLELTGDEYEGEHTSTIIYSLFIP